MHDEGGKMRSVVSLFHTSCVNNYGPDRRLWLGSAYLILRESMRIISNLKIPNRFLNLDSSARFNSDEIPFKRLLCATMSSTPVCVMCERSRC